MDAHRKWCLGLVLLASGAMLVASGRAQADRTLGIGAFPHLSDGLIFHGAMHGLPDTCEFPAGEWTEWHVGWGTETYAELQHWMDTVIVEVAVDGEPADFERMTWDDGDMVGEAYFLLQHPLSVGRHSVLATWTWTEPHFDGWGWTCCPNPDGCCTDEHPTCDAELDPLDPDFYSEPDCLAWFERTVVITPRDEYPSHPDWYCEY